MMQEQKIKEAAAYLKKKCSHKPKIGVILGSGLGEFGDQLEAADYFNYQEIPHFPISTVEGHKGRFAVTKDFLCMQGRFHFYEGYTMKEVTFPIRVMKELGIEKLVITNAAGGVNRDFEGGSLMVITDHINLMGDNPLIGENLDSFGPRFPDMSEAYCREYREKAFEIGEKLDIPMERGVYVGFSGPNYETPAEVRMARILGGDAVGMSTVPEVIAARHCGIKVLGISCITNMAAGVSGKPLCHEEVTKTANAVKGQFIQLLSGVLDYLLTA